MRSIHPAVYILASGRNGTLYVGVTSDLVKRAWQHRSGETGGFTSRYGVHRLVWFEQHGDMEHAIAREKRLKKWNRAWKVRLIEERNLQWCDLWDEVLGVAEPQEHKGPHSGGPPGTPGFPPARE